MRRAGAPRGPAAAAPRTEVLTLHRLDQVRALADPLRMRILEVFCRGERTTKQVADELGEKPTRLYHHVGALERAGLVRRTRTQPKRGTVEQYYAAVATAFRTDPRLLAAGAVSEGARAVGDMAGRMLDRTSAELRSILAGDSTESKSFSEVGVLSFLELHASEAEMTRVRRALLRLVEGAGRAKGGAEERRFRLTIAFFPLDKA